VRSDGVTDALRADGTCEAAHHPVDRIPRTLTVALVALRARAIDIEQYGWAREVVVDIIAEATLAMLISREAHECSSPAVAGNQRGSRVVRATSLVMTSAPIRGVVGAAMSDVSAPTSRLRVGRLGTRSAGLGPACAATEHRRGDRRGLQTVT